MLKLMLFGRCLDVEGEGREDVRIMVIVIYRPLFIIA